MHRNERNAQKCIKGEFMQLVYYLIYGDAVREMGLYEFSAGKFLIRLS